MSEYISKEYIRNVVQKRWDDTVGAECYAYGCVLDDIGEAPTVEVVHGHMVERIVDHECPWYKVFDCSECGCSVEVWHNYCPNCGAKMDCDGNG